VDATKAWNALIPAEGAGALCRSLAQQMRDRRLTFGGRLLCPFLRPFFVDGHDEPRVRQAVEALWVLGERVVQAALRDHTLFTDLGLSDEEIRLALLDPGYKTASTAARADAFLLPESLAFAEYNAESPAGLAYSQGLAELFDETSIMERFRDGFDARMYRPVDTMREALLSSYREFGGASNPTVAIVDWREVPTFTEFELLRDAFTRAGVRTVISDPRELTYEEASTRGPEGLYAAGQRIDLVYRRVLLNDIVARPDECRALLTAYERRSVCVANTLQCKIPHKKAFFAVLTDDRRAALFSAAERALIEHHVPWTAVVREGIVRRRGEDLDLLPYLRNHRNRMVIKPNDEYGGSGVTLGWETSESAWDATIERAIGGGHGTWVAQEKIEVRRDVFPVCTDDGIQLREMLVDFAPYVFRGRLAGFLTRLSATGLANVTSGGGQVPAFVVEGRIR
jgi:uncharacterized circularly permuted ATP-grasp superfamily protein